jgi:hypothetical protein
MKKGREIFLSCEMKIVGTTSAWTAIVVEQLRVTNGAKLVHNAD